MMNYEIKIDQASVDNVEKEMEENIKIAVKKLGQAMQKNAVFEITTLGAVDTGNLRNSIEYTDNGKDEASVGTNVNYAQYVEYGTSRMGARPFLKQAIENHTKEYQSIMQQALKGQ